MYRKNKYNESIEVEKYECGSCKNYEFIREDRDNYCNHYCKYYSYKDYCKNYWELSEDVWDNGGCFLTTACCMYKGLPDDCQELQCLRKFRDEVLLKTEEGYQLVKQYYKIAPPLVEKIESHTNREEILEEIYQKVKKIEVLVLEGNDKKAVAEYMEMVFKVQEIV